MSAASRFSQRWPEASSPIRVCAAVAPRASNVRNSVATPPWKIVEVVERADAARAPIQKLADRLSGYLVYFALGAAAVTFLVTRDDRATISVVIVAGACGIAAGTPLAILGAIGQAARRGAVIKGGRYLELLAKVDTVVFDKTG